MLSVEKQKAAEQVCSFVEVNKGKTVMVFTDGSVYDAAVGCEACAAVLVPLTGADDKNYGSKCVGEKSKFAEGIMSGLELSVDYFTFSKHRKEVERLYIVCDCSQAIEICVDGLSQYTT